MSLSSAGSSSQSLISSEISIQYLPDEILDYIFTYLDIRQRIRTEAVCRRWRLLGLRGHWTYPTKLRLGGHFHQIQDLVLTDVSLCSILSRCGAALRKFKLSTYCTDVTLASLYRIAHYVRNLTSLTLHLSADENSCLKMFALSCPKLKLVQIDSFEDPMYNEGIFAIAKCCSLLECFYVSNLCLTGKCLAVINPNILLLNLNSCTVTQEAMINLVGRCYSLQELVLEECAELDTDLLHEAFKHFKNTLLTLRVIHHFQVIEWREIIEVLVNLKVLQLFGCRVVDDDLMKVVARGCPKLQVLDIGSSTVTDFGLVELRKLPQLRWLHISHDYFITGYGLELLTAKGVLVQVTLLSVKPQLKAACLKLVDIYPNVRFVME